VAWRDDASSIRFASGFRLPTPNFGAFRFSPGAEYYCISDDVTEIYATAHPGVRLAQAPFVADRIFHQSGRVHVFGYDAPYYRRTRVHKEIVGRAFRIDNDALTADGDFHIPRPWAIAGPFAPVDLDPWSDSLLCVDIRALTSLGDAHPYGLFLSDALIRILRSASNG
jgi:hypothetical protein